MSNSKAVLAIGGRDFQLSGLLDLGVKVVLFQKKDELTQYQIDSIDTIVVFDYLDEEQLINFSVSLHDIYCFDAVMAYREFAQYSCALVADKIGISSNCQLDVIKMTRNKYLMREAVKDSLLLGNVSYSIVSNASDLNRFFSSGISRAIIKPVDGTGSVGVCFVDSSNFECALEFCRNASEADLIVEEYIDGDEYSVESISLNGAHEILAITEKVTTGTPHFVEVGHSQPAKITDREEKSIHSSVVELLKIIGYVTGPAHTEVKICKGVVHIIETHTRNGGDNIWWMTKITTGRDMFKETATEILKLNVEKQIGPIVGAAKMEFLLEPPLGYEKVSDVDVGIDQKNILEVKLGLSMTQGPVINSSSRFGYILAVGDTAEDVEHHINNYIKGEACEF